MRYKLTTKHEFRAEIPYKTSGQEELLIEELNLMKKHWPSITWDLMVDSIVLICNNQRIVTGAADQFLYALNRHDWWRG